MFHYVGNLQIITEKHENLLSSCLDKINVLEKICDLVSSTEIKSSSPITINSSTNKPILHHDPESSQPVLLEQIRAVLQEQAQKEILARSLIINGLQESDNKTDQELVLNLIHEATSLPLLPTDIKISQDLQKKRNSLIAFVLLESFCHKAVKIIVMKLLANQALCESLLMSLEI